MGKTCSNNDVIIYDKYIKSFIKYNNDTSKSIEELIHDYITILNNLVTSGITKGETSSMLKEYAEQVLRIEGQMDTMSKNLTSKLNEFLENVEIFDINIY